MIAKTVEEKIKEVMQDKGISQTFVAKQIAIAEDDLFLCMTGKRKLKISEFLNLCNVLGLDLKDFKEIVL